MNMNERLKAAGERRVACVGIIMDGNRRWALSRGLSGIEGHTAGFTKAREIVRHAFSTGIETIILYAFSTENWSRPPKEVAYLMDLFSGALVRELNEISREGIRVRFIGDFTRLPEKLYASIKKLERESTDARLGKTLVIALSYGGRAEIVAAARAIVARGEGMTEDSLARHLWTAEMPDPDIIIRTGGQKRLSNFLPWQSVYSELFFTDTLWPDFSRDEFDSILAEFSDRERRHGK